MTSADLGGWQLLEVKRDRKGGRGTEQPPPKGEHVSFFGTELIAQTGMAGADISICRVETGTWVSSGEETGGKICNFGVRMWILLIGLEALYLAADRC